jgi:hypothetical protein
MDAAEVDFKLGQVSGVSGVSLFTCMFSRSCNSAVLTEYVMVGELMAEPSMPQPTKRGPYKKKNAASESL